MADQHARVVIDGDASGAQAAARDAATALDKVGASAGKAGRELEKKSKSVDVATKSVSKFTEGAKRMAPPLGAAAAAALTTKASLGSLVSVVLASANAFGPWGVAVAAAGTALYSIVTAQNDAAEATRKHTAEIKKQAAEESKIAGEKFRRGVADLKQSKAQKDFLKQSGIGDLEQELRDVEDAVATARGVGANATGFLTRQAQLRAEVLTLQAKSLEIANKEQSLDEINARYDERDRLTQEAKNILREDELRLMEQQGESSRGTTKEMEKQLEILEQRRRFDPSLGADIDRSIVAQAGAMDESSASRFGGTVIDPFSQENEMQIAEDMLEQAKVRKHEAELRRNEELKQAEEDRIAHIEKNVKIGEQAASMAVAGIIDITDARRDAIRVAKLQGATDRQAAQAGRVAAMMALEQQLKSLRNMAAMHVIEYTAKGIASQASTYGIPNPQSIGYFTAAGVMAGVAVGAGVAAFGVGAAADNMQSGGGSSSGGFGGGFVGAGGGGGTSPRSGASPIDSSIPGSPGPQAPSAGQGSGMGGGGGVVHIHGDQHFYGAGGRKQFVEELEQDMFNVSRNRRKTA